MAKDGTNRGGRRVRAGDKPTPLAEKITAGKTAKVLEAPDLKPETALTGTLLPSPAVLTGTDMPEPSEYLRANQKDGKPLGADALFLETWRWLKERACDQFISPRLVEAYAQAFALHPVRGSYQRLRPVGQASHDGRRDRPVRSCK